MNTAKTLTAILCIALCNCNDAPATKQETTETKTAAPANNTKPEQVVATINAPGLKFGKYGCTASTMRNGTVEYQGRGFLTINDKGQYTYEGFNEPSSGTYTVDEKGNLHFKGGYLDAGEATKIDRPNKFFLTFAANPDNRWTCGLIEE